MTASPRTRERFGWGGVCDGWRLLDAPGLSVIEERVPPGAGERWHVHDRAHRFSNPSHDTDLQILVISAPRSKDDRREWTPRPPTAGAGPAL